MTKCLLLSEVFPPQTGGSGRWFWELYRRLSREEFMLAVGSHPRAGEFDAMHDLRLMRLPLAMPVWGVRSVRALRHYRRIAAAVGRLMRREGVRSIHAGRVLPEGWVAWLVKRWRRIPYLCYVHGEELSYGVASRELAWMMRRVMNGAALIVANSENTRQVLVREWNVSPDRVRVMHPGVDTDWYVPRERSAAARERLGWGERPVVLTVGRLQARKGHDRLIAALPAIREKVPEVLYSIVGEGEERASLKRLVREQGLEAHVEFRGEADDEQLLECFQQCDLFVLPNREIRGDIEGFGIVLLEAQACGRPVVAGNSGGTRETMVPGVSGQWSVVSGQELEDRGQTSEVRGQMPGQEPMAKSQEPPSQPTGLIVDCTRTQPLAEVVSGLLLDADMRERMGRAGRHWVVERFSWSALVAEAVGIFSDLTPISGSLRRGTRLFWG